LAQNGPLASMTGCVELDWFTQTSSVGGSMLTETTDVAIRPA
jgi:hypothetical protein